VAAVLSNSLLFLLIGIETHLDDLWRHGKLIVSIFLLLLIFRAIVVYGIFGVLKLMTRVPPLRWLHVIHWGGLRGSIPIALALGLPQQISVSISSLTLYRQDIISIVFGVVLLSLLIQGVTIKSLLSFLKLSSLLEEPKKYENLLGKLIATKSAREALLNLHNKGEVSHVTFEKLDRRLDDENKNISSAMQDFLLHHQEIHQTEYKTIFRSLLLSQRASLQEAFHRGILSEHSSTELIRNIDARIADSQMFDDDDDEEETFSLDQEPQNT